MGMRRDPKLGLLLGSQRLKDKPSFSQSGNNSRDEDNAVITPGCLLGTPTTSLADLLF